MNKIIPMIVGGVLLAGLLVIAVIALMSMVSVEFDEYAIVYYSFTESVDREVILEEGRHFVSPSGEIYRYKKTLMTMEMVDYNSIQCLTSEGLNMELDISTQYLIDPNHLYDILLSYGPQDVWQEYLIRLTKDSFKDTCSKFTGQDYYNRRGLIETTLLEDLQIAYKNSNSHATSQLVQLRNVDHPDAYQDANIKKQSIAQEIDRIVSERDKKITEEKTKLLQAEGDANIKLLKTEAEVNSIRVAANMSASAELAKWEQRAKMLSYFKKTTGQDNNYVINDYLRYLALKDHDSVIVQVDPQSNN